MLLCRVVLALLLLVLLHYCQAEEEPPPSTVPPVPLAESLSSGSPRASSSDVYIGRNQRQCFETRSLVSCIKYKASKLIWKLATNSLGFFPNEYGRDKGRWLRLVQLGEPANEVVVFNDAKSLEGGVAASRNRKLFRRKPQLRSGIAISGRNLSVRGTLIDHLRLDSVQGTRCSLAG